MVGICANPTCSARFHTLRRGKLFLLEAKDVEPPVPADREPAFAPIPHRIQYFWLCESCAQTMRVVYDRRSGIRVEPLLAVAGHAHRVTTGPERGNHNAESNT